MYKVSFMLFEWKYLREKYEKIWNSMKQNKLDPAGFIKKTYAPACSNILEIYLEIMNILVQQDIYMLNKVQIQTGVFDIIRNLQYEV